MSILASLIVSSAAFAQQGWQPTFGEGVRGPELPYWAPRVKTFADFDPGGNEPVRLVIAGDIDSAAGVPTNQVASWDGLRWRPMDAGLAGVTINVLHRTNATRELYAGGSSPNGAFVARWNGSTWQPIPPPVPAAGAVGQIDYLHAFDPDGAGPLPEVLIAAGSNWISHWPTTWLFEWDGMTWRQIAQSLTGRAVDATVLQKPDGRTDLYVALSATGTHGTSMYALVRWDGTEASTVAADACFQTCSVGLKALEVVNDLPGGQGALYVSGGFTTFAGVAAAGVARWDGQMWRAANAGLSVAGVGDMNVFDLDGAGPEPPRLIAVTEGPALRSWNGSLWSNPIVMFSSAPNRIVPFDDGVESLFAIGSFSVTGNNYTTNMSRSIGPLWAPVGQALNNSVYSLLSLQDGLGAVLPGLYASGAFYTAGNTVSVGIGRWSGSKWTALLEGADDQVFAMAAGPPHSSALYVGGRFTTRPGHHVGKWDGSGWSSVGGGLNGDVHALLVTDEGAVYAGGAFVGPASPHIAKWEGGANWLEVGPQGTNGVVYALAARGSEVFAGGAFTSAGSVPVDHVARWNGTVWSPLGSGLNGTVRTLTFLGDVLIAGGDFTQSGATPVARVALWTGQTWVPLGKGLNGPVHALTEFDPDGVGPLPVHLIAGGAFTVAGGVAANRVAKWNGLSWSPFGIGTDNAVRALATFDTDGSGARDPSLFLGGDFRTAGGVPNSFIAQWSPACYPNCDGSTGPPILTANDFACFLTLFAAQDPYANCDGSTTIPILTANDFTCFLSAFARGCP